MTEAELKEHLMTSTVKVVMAAICLALLVGGFMFMVAYGEAWTH